MTFESLQETVLTCRVATCPFQLRVSLSSTLRRLGEELFRPRGGRSMDEDSSTVSERSHSKDKSTGLYFRSGSLHTRFLSALVILKTVSQGEWEGRFIGTSAHVTLVCACV